MLAQILAKLTSFRAAYTDAKAAYLDAAITSRAPSSTALSTSVWNGTKAGYLNTTISSRAAESSITALQSDVTAIKADTDAYLDATVSSAARPIPTSLGLPTAFNDVYSVEISTYLFGYTGHVSCGASVNAWYDVLNVSGSGFFEWLSVYQSSTGATANYQCRMTIDGTQVYISDSNAWSGDMAWAGVSLCGHVFKWQSDGSAHGFSLGRLDFSTSAIVQVRCTSANDAHNFACQYRYVKF